MNIKTNQKLYFNLAKVIIALVSMWYIYHTLHKSSFQFAQARNPIAEVLNFQNAGILIFILFLAFINWGLEALKWQFLISKIESMSFVNACKGVLSGLALGFITPHSIGDYVGRIYFLKMQEKAKAIGVVLLARVSQFYITLFYGIMGFFCWYHFSAFNSRFFNPVFMFLIVFLSFIFLIALLNFSKVNEVLQKFRWMQWIGQYLNIISQYKLRDFIITFSLSLARYFIFTFQYLLLLHLFFINVFDVQVISGIWLVFFAKSVFPAFNFLSDLGIREASALFFLGKVSPDPLNIIISGLFLWLINILFPTLAGLLIILGLKNKG